MKIFRDSRPSLISSSFWDPEGVSSFVKTGEKCDRGSDDRHPDLHADTQKHAN